MDFQAELARDALLHAAHQHVDSEGHYLLYRETKLAGASRDERIKFLITLILPVVNNSARFVLQDATMYLHTLDATASIMKDVLRDDSSSKSVTVFASKVKSELLRGVRLLPVEFPQGEWRQQVMAIDCILRKEIKQSLQTCLGISDDSETTFERLSEELLVFGAVALFSLGLVFEKKALRELISVYTGKRPPNDEG